MEKIVLREHQVEAVEKMCEIERIQEKGAVLAHQMGLGKSLTMSYFLIQKRLLEKPERPDLIICPLSVLSHWKTEISRLDSSAKVLVYHGSDRHKFFDSLKTYDIVIGTYHCLITNELGKKKWNRVVLDEAHLIRNGIEAKHRKLPKKVTGAFELKKVSKFRWCVTGTPFNNRVEDVYSLMEFMGYKWAEDEKLVIDFVEKCVLQKDKKGILDDYITHMIPIDTPEFENIEKGQEIMGPYIDSFQSYYLAMNKMQRTHNPVDARQYYIQAMNHLTKMRIFCNLFTTSVQIREYTPDPDGEDGDELYEDCPFTEEQMITFYDSSPKIKKVYKEILEWIPKSPQGKILIFSSYTTILNIINAVIKHKGNKINCLMYHGSMNRKDRDEAIKTFSKNAGPEEKPTVFLATFGSGSCGINLVPCATVFVVDIPMNPFDVLQAVNRVHRLTQKSQVNVVKFYMKDLIESKILKSHNKKIQISNDIGLKSELIDLEL